MATRKKTTSRTPKAQTVVDEAILGPDVAKLFDLKLYTDKSDAYDVQVLTVNNDQEQYILDQFHQQHVAIEGRAAIARLTNTRIGDMATNTSLTNAALTENIETIEAEARVGKRRAMLEGNNNQLAAHTAKQFMMTDAIAARSMHEDMRRDLYQPPKEPPPPPRPRRKGMRRKIEEWWNGEE